MSATGCIKIYRQNGPAIRAVAKGGAPQGRAPIRLHAVMHQTTETRL